METVRVMLSIIAINHNSSELLSECFKSIISTVTDMSYEFIAVDSGSDGDNVDRLLSFAKMGATVLLNKENIGYSRAVNIGLSKAKGDFLLIINPDIIFEKDAINKMFDMLRATPQCGGVGPRAWWNRGKTFLLPVSEYVSPFSMLKKHLSNKFKTIRDMFLRRWLRQNTVFWQSKSPTKQDMLSGACIMTTRKVVEKVGGFDEAFPLYFEDADWCLRALKAGYVLYMLPAAEIIHYYNQSAKRDVSSAQRKFVYSREVFIKKHFAAQQVMFNLAKHILNVFPERGLDTFVDLGGLSNPPEFNFDDGRKKVFLISPLSNLMPSAGSIFATNNFKIPDDLWDCLAEGIFYSSAFYIDDLTQCGAWTWMR